MRGLTLSDKTYVKIRQHCAEYQNILVHNIKNMSVENFDETTRVKNLYKDCVHKVKMGLL
jgi:hypothetical protein